MSRLGKVKKRTIEPDPLYQSRLVTHLINRVMVSGKKTIAQKQIYKALEALGKEKGKDKDEKTNPFFGFREFEADDGSSAQKNRRGGLSGADAG